MTGRDTKAHLTGFTVGLVGIALVVITLVILTNKKFASHEAEGAAATSTQH
jgi:hypothetical protein